MVGYVPVDRAGHARRITPYLRRLVVSLSQQSYRFNFSAMHGGLWWTNWHWHRFSRVLRLYPVTIIPPTLHIAVFIYRRSYMISLIDSILKQHASTHPRSLQSSAYCENLQVSGFRHYGRLLFPYGYSSFRVRWPKIQLLPSEMAQYTALSK
jgi:hypothetical protein